LSATMSKQKEKNIPIHLAPALDPCLHKGSSSTVRGRQGHWKQDEHWHHGPT
jgi:hypothetical protein